MLRDMMQNQDTSIEPFVELIEQIISIPDESIDENRIEMILGMINGALTPKTREETVLAILEEMKRKTPAVALEVIQSLDSATEDLLEEFGEISEHKKVLIRGIFDMIKELSMEAYGRLGKYDTVIHFQLTHSNAKVPTYAHDTDAGADIYVPEDVTIAPNARGQMVDTGFKMAMSPGWMMDVRPRSGLSYKTTMRIANTPGTIDAGYRDNVGILIDNLSDEPIVIHAGDRIAQFLLHPVYRFKGEVVEDVNSIDGNRGGGFGSSINQYDSNRV